MQLKQQNSGHTPLDLPDTKLKKANQLTQPTQPQTQESLDMAQLKLKLNSPRIQPVSGQINVLETPMLYF